MVNLEEHRLPTPVPEAFVLEDFIDAPTEAYLLSKIEELGGTEVESSESSTRAFKSKGTPAGWKTVSGRRLMEWG